MDCREQGYPAFGLYLIACRSGARPQQIRDVEATNVIGQTWVFKRHKSIKKTQKPLMVFLSPCLLTITKVLLARRLSGPLFVNDNGEPWKKDSVDQRMRRIRKRLDLPPATVVYAYRHGFATDALLSGVSIATVAQLLEHTSTQMVSRVYGHLDQHQQHLINAAAMVRKKSE